MSTPIGGQIAILKRISAVMEEYQKSEDPRSSAEIVIKDKYGEVSYDILSGGDELAGKLKDVIDSWIVTLQDIFNV